MNEDNLSYFERRVSQELEEIERQIKELEDEKRALQRQLAKARSERTGLQAVTRKNSLNRVVAENSVIEFLRRNGNKPLSMKQLYKNALLTNYDLKENTFRTYLHRMKEKEIIKPARITGHWILTDGYVPK